MITLNAIIIIYKYFSDLQKQFFRLSQKLSHCKDNVNFTSIHFIEYIIATYTYSFVFMWVWAYVCRHACYSVRVEIRGPPGEFTLLFYHGESRDWTWVISLGSKNFYPLRSGHPSVFLNSMLSVRIHSNITE